ncbi:MAG TPA: hypothetical protein VJS15_08655 [Allosphingosinicella sp.]|nr:hypothetical protein [Allosphingosinicella sp.]
MARKTGFEALMEVVAGEWCLGQGLERDGKPRDMTRFIPAAGSVGADDFVRWAFEASDVAPDDPAPRWERARIAIRAAFVAHMGADAVDAAALRWPESDAPPCARMPLPDPEAFARNLTDEELEEEMNAREDWRDRRIAQRELARRRGPAAWVRWVVGAAALLWLLLAYWAWF